MHLSKSVFRISLAGAMLFALSACGGGNDDPAQGGTLANPPAPTSANFELVWSDEFDGDSLDTTKWDIQVGDGSSEGIPGWGNNELQYYTADNLSLVDGNLVIEARVGDSPDPAYNFTSGRIRTQGKLDFTYGRVEASIKVPEGLGLWGAFWMLGTDPSPYGVWAAKGEIDIMESFGQQTSFLSAAMHYGMAAPLNERVDKIRTDINPSDGFHQYAVEWDSEKVRWFVDGEHYFTVSAETYWNYYYKNNTEGFVLGEDDAPFNANQHILLNLAVGGNPAGVPNANDTAVFPGQMLVDYVRVYQCPFAPASNGLGCEGTIDPVNPFVITQGGDGTPAPQNVSTTEYDLYVDAPAILFAGTNSERTLGFGVFDNDGALTLEEVDSGDAERSTVMEIKTTGGGNVQINDPTGNSFNLFGVGTAGDTAPYGGQLSFDVKVFSADTDTSGNLQVKMDSGFPNVGFVNVALADLPADEWQTLYISMTEVLNGGIGAFGGGPLNIEEVLNLIVFEPTSAAHIQIDNVKFSCGSPASRTCGIVTVATQPTNVYIDSVDPIWTNGIGAADSGSDFAAYSDGTNPSGTNKVQWQEVSEDDRGQVIEVTFNDSSAFGVWYIQSTNATNLAGYGGGAVVFDLLVSDYGNNTSGMTMKIDCIFPCTSGDQNLGVVADGVWETIEVPLSQLISGGLNTTTVNTGLVLFPTAQSGDITFKVDNIRWEPVATPVEDTDPVANLSFSTDFEDSIAGAGQIGNGWSSFASVFSAAGDFIYNYGVFATPNNTGAFANIATGEAGAEQGTQYMSVFSDYNNADHTNGSLNVIETLSFQERTIEEGDSGSYAFSFDAKAPNEFAIAAPSTAFGFVKILDPSNGFATVFNLEVDLSMITAAEWQTYTLDIVIDGTAQAGQLLQFGFRTVASESNSSAVLVDNVSLGPQMANTISYVADFESSDALLNTLGDNWKIFASVFNSANEPAYTYGPFDAPNNGNGFSTIATGEQGDDQGMQYLNVFNDYNNADHGNGFTIQALVFQERTLAEGQGGTYTLSFDAKAPDANGIAAPSRAFAFIKTLDPNNGFATTTNIELDMSAVGSSEWMRFDLDLELDTSVLNGQILQFGFSNSATAFNPSGIYYDNIRFEVVQ